MRLSFAIIGMSRFRVGIMKEVNIKQFSKFNRREPPGGMNSLLGEVTKDFMTTIDGSQWRRVRHSTLPLMSASKLSSIIPLINKVGLKLIPLFI